MKTCESLITYLNSSFKNGIEIKTYDEGCTVVTPLLRPNLDNIQFYVEFSRGKVIITDDGETVGDLFLQGLDVTTEKRVYKEIQKIAATHQLKFINYVLSIETDEENVGDASLRLLNAMQATSYLSYKISARPHSKFVGQVETFLLDHKIAYQSQPDYRGATTTNRFSYYVNGSRNLLIDAMSTSTPNRAKDMAIKSVFKRDDLRDAGVQVNIASLLDDRRGLQIWEESEALSILRGRNVNVVFWSEREEKLLPLLMDGSPNSSA